MKSMTIHGIDDPLDKRIREKAKSHGLSLNKTIKKLLNESLGIQPGNENDHKKEFIDLFGIWSESDEKDFNRTLKDFDKVDPEDWA